MSSIRVNQLVELNGFKVPSKDLFKEVEGRHVFHRYVSKRSGNIVDIIPTKWGYEKKVTRVKTGEVFSSYQSWISKPSVSKEVIKDGKVCCYRLFTSRGRKLMLKVSKLANMFHISSVPVPKANWVAIS